MSRKNRRYYSTHAAKRRISTTDVPSTPDRDSRPLEIEYIEALAADHAVYALAKTLPAKTDGSTGPGRAYPEVLVIFYIALAGVLGSHRKAAKALSHSRYWSILRDGCARHGINLNPRPPKRWNCQDARKRVLDASTPTTEGHVSALLDTLRAQFVAEARALAKRHGCLRVPQRRSLTHPERGNVAYADGKVISSIYTEKAVKKREAAGQRVDGELHKEGDKKDLTLGMKFQHIVVRPNTARNSRIFLDMLHTAPGSGGEAAISVDALLDLAAAEPGATTVCYDGAFRGVHLQPLADAGYLIFSPPHETTAALRPFDSLTCTCGRTHKLYTHKGSLVVEHIDEDGTVGHDRCRVLKLQVAHRTTGRYDWYLTIQLPCGTAHRVRINEPASEGATHRMEYLRQAVAAEDDQPATVYNRIYPYRSDAESANNTIDVDWYRGRAISTTCDGQYLVMLGHALARNAYADRLWRHEHPDPDDPPVT